MATFGNPDGKSLGVAGGAAPDDQQITAPPEYQPDDSDSPPDIAALTADDEDVEKPEPTEAQTPVDYPARPFRDGEPRSEGAVARTAPDPAPEVIEDSAALAIADRFDVTTTGEVWPYDHLHFKGDLLGIRLPQRQALAAFSLATSKYVALGVKNDLTGLFIARHLSPESYGRVFSRLMDPDEDDYDVDTVGELFNEIVTASIEADKSEGGDKPK